MSEEWRTSVERHRETLEKLAEHGETQLANDARQLLEAVEKEGQ